MVVYEQDVWRSPGHQASLLKQGHQVEELDPVLQVWP